MMFSCRFTLLVFVATLYATPTGGALSLSRQKRVVGGQEYGDGDYPFHVSLWYMGDNNPYTANTPDLHHTCGGALIGDRWVLTSGVCFDDNFLQGLGNTSLWRVYLGMHAQTDAEANAQYHSIDQVFTVPEYNLTQSYGDLALLKLDRPATMGDTVGVVEVNGDGNCPAVDQEVTVIGWGQTQTHTYGLGSDVPHEATVRVSTLAHCQDKYVNDDQLKMYGFRVDERTLCAGLPEGGVDACYGDLGSPLLSKCGSDNNQQLVVVGTVSYGYGCALPDYPAVYSRVSSYYDWIVATIKNNS